MKHDIFSEILELEADRDSLQREVDSCSHQIEMHDLRVDMDGTEPDKEWLARVRYRRANRERQLKGVERKIELLKLRVI
jgi:hypothetical protein